MSTLKRIILASVVLCWGAGCMVPIESDESGEERSADLDAELVHGDDLAPRSDVLRQIAVQRALAQHGDAAAAGFDAGDAYDDDFDPDGPNGAPPQHEDTEELARANMDHVAGPDPDPWHLYPTDGDPDDSDEESGPDPDPWEPQADGESVEDDG